MSIRGMRSSAGVAHRPRLVAPQHPEHRRRVHHRSPRLVLGKREILQFRPERRRGAQGVARKAGWYAAGGRVDERQASIQHPDDGYLLEAERGLASDHVAAGSHRDHRIRLHRHAVPAVASVIGVEHRPGRLAVEGDMHLLLTALEGGNAQVGRTRYDPSAGRTGQEIQLLMAWATP